MTADAFKDRIVEFGRKPASQFLAHPQNWRKHPTRQREAVGQSLSGFGWVAPVIENRRTGHLIDGHERIFQALELDADVPYILIDVDPDEEMAILATFDPLTLMADTDDERLQEILNDLKVSDLTANDPDLDALLATVAGEAGLSYNATAGSGGAEGDPGSQLAEAERLRLKWGTALGQVWEIPSVTVPGRFHRLICGDATNEADVARVLGGLAPRLMVTDPPCGVDYDQDWRSENRVGKVTNDHTANWDAAYALSPSKVAYVWYAHWHHADVERGLLAAGFENRTQIIWNKPRHVYSRGHYHWKHEPCLYCVRRGDTADWIGDRKQNTVWDVEPDPDAPGEHGTQKPVELMARSIRNHAGDVYDPFLGSGTTMIAAEINERICFGIEISPGYVAAILERLAGFGLEPRWIDGPAPQPNEGSE